MKKNKGQAQYWTGGLYAARKRSWGKLPLFGLGEERLYKNSDPCRKDDSFLCKDLCVPVVVKTSCGIRGSREGWGRRKIRPIESKPNNVI